MAVSTKDAPKPSYVTNEIEALASDARILADQMQRGFIGFTDVRNVVLAVISQFDSDEKKVKHIKIYEKATSLIKYMDVCLCTADVYDLCNFLIQIKSKPEAIMTKTVHKTKEIK